MACQAASVMRIGAAAVSGVMAVLYPRFGF
jgi:hypothetical protein